jgi:pimeloyl-ACP methyl ester carboxylesterase
MLLSVASLSLYAQGKNPVIFIPGLSGSELLHKDTGERVWFRAIKSKREDLRLPIYADLSKNRDSLIPGDILRTVKVGPFSVTDVYGGFVRAMQLRGGYREEKWSSPSENGHQDALYVFSYDWRLDAVDNARRLFDAVEALKLKLKRPDLKFDIVAHSLGGIISRYAAMYGNADLPADGRKAKPTWAGARHFHKIVLMGTPNEGSVLSLSSLANGFSVGGVRIDLPFLEDTSKFTVFTIPSAYQLLPAPGTLKAFDDRLEPVEIDIYDPKVWKKYGWSVIEDRDFPGRFSAAERKTAEAYFAAVLDRAKRTHMALAAGDGQTKGVAFMVLGADCRTALDSILVYRDRNTDKWVTMFRPKGFTRWDGEKITDAELRKVMMAPGDGVVTRRSLETGRPGSIGGTAGKFICGDHSRLAANIHIQDHVIGWFDGKVPTETVDLAVRK